MKKFIVELDDQCALELERVAPASQRLRAEFVRRAIRREIDRALDRVTVEAYRVQPMPEEPTSVDMLGWDPHNQLAKKSPEKTRKRANARPKRRAHSKAA